MVNPVVRKPSEFVLPVFFSTSPAEHRDRRLALATVLFSLLIFIVAAPFARLPLSPVRAFIPIYETALTFCDLITAILLFTQFSILRFRALLVLACGYLFTALITVAHMLSFPGLFSPTGMLGAGPQTTAWLYMFWHGIFPITVITYALVKDGARATGLARASARVALPVSIVSVVAVVVTLTSLATIGDMLLPVIMQGNNYTSVMIFVVSTVWVLSVAAVLVLWTRPPHTVLDLWLMVVMCAWIFDLALSAVLNAGRFDLGFYVGRIYGLLASAFVLLVLLFETSALYAKLARSFVTEQRERQREMEERHRIFETSPDLILIVDRQGNFVQVSPSSESILGYRAEEIIGHNASKFVFSYDLEPAREEMRSMRHGRPMRNFATRYLHRDNRTVALVWTGVWSETTQQYFFIGRDMTEQNLAEDKFRLAVEASPSGLVMIDGGGSIVLINAETERLFGYKRHELIGQPVDILVPSRMRGHHVQHRSGFVTQPSSRRMGIGRDLYGLRKDGTEFPIEIGLNPIHTQGGLLVLTAIVDISERKRAEATLREYAEREQLFIAAVESSDDAIVTETLDGVITGWNQAAERLFGFTPEEAIGKSINIVVPNELRDEVLDILGRIKFGEKVAHHETVRTNKDGQRIDISLSVSPVKSQSGAIIGAAKVARDISARKKTQEALLESEQMAQAIIDTALDAFVQLDEAGTIMRWNPKAEAMFGWSSQAAVGQNLRDLIIPAAGRAANSERLAQFLRESQTGTRGKRYEATSLRRDGLEIKTEISLTSLRRRDGYTINGFIRDVTDKLAAEEQLRHAQKMESVGELTGGIAHDFNNMLTVVTSTVDILADAVADKPNLAAIVKLISEAADRGAELTGHLLAFARKQPLQPRETDVNALIMESAKLMRPTFGEQIEIESIFSNDAWPTLVDPSQLSSALMNLAINARDAMPSGGKLTLETRNVILDQSYAAANSEVQPGNYLMIAVSDTGAGIPEAIREKVFEPFFTTKEIGKGTGLGLSMVYGFVKQSNGHIKVYSEEGHGTTFRIYLPQSGARQDEFVDTLPESEFHIGNETILVVEDDELVRTSVITQLHGLGYEVLSASNAAEALAIVNGGANFDLLFTDVIMPGQMNGPQLAEEIAKRRTSLKVLFTSGYTSNAIIHHGRLDPGVLLLSKPYRKPELARMLRLALASLGPTPSKQTAALSARAS